MSGSVSGVAARISSENPRALYVHCAKHSLDLALQGCAKASQTIRFKHWISFKDCPPKRMAQHQHIVAEHSVAQAENPHLLCPTRWTVRTKSISVIVRNYEALYSTLLGIAEESNKPSVRDTASGLTEVYHILWFTFCSEYLLRM